MEAFKMSVQAIMAHKMRSLLTMLGIIIGIASVVSVVALGNGSQQKSWKTSTRWAQTPSASSPDVVLATVEADGSRH